jgi:hypothetical protein
MTLEMGNLLLMVAFDRFLDVHMLHGHCMSPFKKVVRVLQHFFITEKSEVGNKKTNLALML